MSRSVAPLQRLLLHGAIVGLPDLEPIANHKLSVVIEDGKLKGIDIEVARHQFRARVANDEGGCDEFQDIGQLCSSWPSRGLKERSR